MVVLSGLEFALPNQSNKSKTIANVIKSSLAFAVSDIYTKHANTTLVICEDFVSAYQLERELHFLDKQAIVFPDWETLPYDSFSPHEDLIAHRLRTLSALLQGFSGVVIAPVSTLMHRLCPLEQLSNFNNDINIGDKLDLQSWRAQLIAHGYQHTNQVTIHGEFSIRGSILDLFPMSSEAPFRIDLFDDEVESIRVFNVEDQCSQEKVDSIKLLPAKEYPFDKKSISKFRQNWREYFDGNPQNCSVYQDISNQIPAAGIEYYLPLFFDATATLFDYIAKNSLIIKAYDIENEAHKVWQQINTRFDQYAHDINRPILQPKDIFLSVNELFSKISEFNCIVIQENHGPNDAAKGKFNLALSALPDLTIEYKNTSPLKKLNNFIENYSGKVLFCSESTGRKANLAELLLKHKMPAHDCEHWQDVIKSNAKINIIVAPFTAGFILNCENLVIITESETLGVKVVQQQKRRKKAIDPSNIVKNLVELDIDSAVVHLEYGIGLYKGLTMLTIGEIENEFLVIEYLQQDKIYVPVANLHLISRYSSANLDNVPINSLRDDKWQKQKKQVALQIRDVAAELLLTYAKRVQTKGLAFKVDPVLYQDFVGGFKFEETYDQNKAINDVLADMQAAKTMDRVICGDVGFGKTEVAMRASFIAVMNNTQVAILVPTTLLASQHFQSFKDRFADFPVSIELVSRFRTKKDTQVVIDKIANSKVDIIIGTHKLLQDDIKFSNLGLLVIDEEHRFGVRQKDKFKELRAQVDILTLTATPIPRTLNMSMGGMRDLSIIATPPAKRLSVKTFVREYSKSIVVEATMRELNRGGQIYYLHNKVETIEKTAQELQEWLPLARVVVAHGQLPERELEQIMTDFYHRKYNVLVCTTIIETGIDLPNSNTIIVERADKFGLAQLHQLRGRVGRSHHQAYAFCLTPNPKGMSKDAIKRLDAIGHNDSLGAGFTIATHDLEIRGAGELLGDQQSGNIQSIGFSLYMELLSLAVKQLKAGKEPDFMELEHQLEIDLQIPCILPNNYVHDVHTRLTLYKRIVNATNNIKLENIKAEIIDRFGLLPVQAVNLFRNAELKLLAQKLKVKKIKFAAFGGKIEFSEQPNIDSAKIIDLVQKNPTKYRLAGSSAIAVTCQTSSFDARFELVENILLHIQATAV